MRQSARRLARRRTLPAGWSGLEGLAAADAHRDAILGASLLGGTTYGLMRTQIDARRLEVWSNGLEALDCAREASLPLDLEPDRREQLKEARKELAVQRLAVQNAIQNVRNAIAPLAKIPDVTASASTVVEKAQAALAEADRTQAAAIDLLEASRGRELSAAVDRVHTGVTKAMRDIAVDPKSIKPLIAGLGGFAEVFAPGSGIEGALLSALANYKPPATGAGAHAGVDLEPLDASVQDLQTHASALADALARTRALVKDVDVAQIATALKKCGVAGVVAPLTLEPATLPFASPGSKGFEIKGGTPPYEVKPLDLLPEGLTPVFSGGLADMAQVKVAAGVPEGEYRLRVADSSPVTRTQQLLVSVSGSGGTGGGNETPPATATKTDTAWTALLAAIQKTGFSFKVGATVLQVSQATRTSSGLKVTVTCSPANAKVPVADVRDKLAAANPDAQNELKAAGALDADATQIVVSGSSNCVSG
jgi:hypothetical protein